MTNLLNPARAAHLLGVTVRTLDNWRARGIGPAYYRLEGQIRYRTDDIEAWLEANRVEPETLPLPFLLAAEITDREARHRLDSSIFVATGLQGTPLFASKNR